MTAHPEPWTPLPSHLVHTTVYSSGSALKNRNTCCRACIISRSAARLLGLRLWGLLKVWHSRSACAARREDCRTRSGQWACE